MASAGLSRSPMVSHARDLALPRLRLSEGNNSIGAALPPTRPMAASTVTHDFLWPGLK